MKPAPFVYEKPASVDEALALLSRHGLDAKVLAGGQSLMPMLNMRLARPAVLVDINGLVELDRIEERGEGTAIGALVRQQRMTRDPTLTTRLPLLGRAARWMSHPQIRNRGTIVGSVVHGDPSAELPAVALVLEGTLTARSHRGERRIRIADFYQGYYLTALEPDELVTEIEFPGLQAEARCGIQEVSRRHGDFALAGGVALGTFDSGRIVTLRLSCYGLGGAALRLPDLEARLQGETPAGDLLRRLAREVCGSLPADGDIHASADYRRALVAEMLARAIEEAAAGPAANQGKKLP